jgi:hypothetical protein
MEKDWELARARIAQLLPRARRLGVVRADGKVERPTAPVQLRPVAPVLAFKRREGSS